MARVFDGKKSFRDKELSDLWRKGELLDHSLSELFTIGSPQGCWGCLRNRVEEWQLWIIPDVLKSAKGFLNMVADGRRGRVTVAVLHGKNVVT